MKKSSKFKTISFGGESWLKKKFDVVNARLIIGLINSKPLHARSAVLQSRVQKPNETNVTA